MITISAGDEYMEEDKKNNPLISVIVPVYNIENYIARCIESIRNQTYDNLEIILVDDGSTDNSGSICDYYAGLDERIKVIHKKNGGLVSARKEGIVNSSGQFAAYVDGDDWIEDTMYECLMNKIDNADVIVSGVKRDYNDYSVCEKNKFPAGIYQGKALNQLYGSMIFTGTFFERGIQPHIFNVLYKKDLLYTNQLLVPNEIRVGEDAACIYPVLLEARKVVLVDEAYYHYVMRPDSIMGTKIESELKQSKILYGYLKQRFIKYENVSASLLEQLKYLMVYILLLKNIKVLQSDKNTLFPYEVSGKKIVVYGAGRFGCELVEYITQETDYEVVLWVREKEKEDNKLNLMAEEYDCILIAALLKDVVDEIEKDILNIGILPEKVRRIDMNQIQNVKIDSLMS